MPATADTLVVGYGSDLRGDDAVGRRAAERVRAWGLPHVRVISAHQLTPDLASPIAAARRVLFLDAHPAALDRRRRLCRLHPGHSTTHLGHAGTPQTLLAWAHALYGTSPDAWWITLPAHTFALGAGLSRATRDALHAALPAIRRLLDEPEGSPVHRSQRDGSRPGRASSATSNLAPRTGNRSSSTLGPRTANRPCSNLAPRTGNRFLTPCPAEGGRCPTR